MYKHSQSLFLEYLQAKHHERLQSKTLNFLINHRSVVEERLSNNVLLRYIHLVDLYYQFVRLEDKDDDWIEFDIIVIPDIICDVFDIVYRDINQECPSDLWISITCKARVSDILSDFSILDVALYSPKKSNKPLSDDLIPIIAKKEYDNYATELLKLYYPEAFSENYVGPINIRLIADRMGIAIKERSISPNGTIFGQAVFSGTTINLFDSKTEAFQIVNVRGNTMIVDTEATANFSLGSKYFTIAHELVHFYLHRKAFRFAQLINKDFAFMQCQVDGGLKGESRDARSNWMEIQANGIAPCILMPKHLVLHRVETLMAYYESNELSKYDYAERLINDIANMFEVSIYSAKKRLLELGIDFVGGVLNWIDGHYVPAYFYEQDSLGQDETYTISVKDAYSIAFKQGATSILLAQGNFVFVENHLCIDSPKYVNFSRHGSAKLTDYARLHIDECCVKFKCKPKDIFVKNSTEGAWCYLLQDFNKNIFEWELETIENNKLLSNPEFPSRRQEYSKQKNEILSNISSMSFGDGLKYILQRFDLSQEYLAIEADLDDHTISRYCTGKSSSPDKRSIIAICIALRLPPEITLKLLQQAGRALRVGDADDDMLDFVIRTMRGLSIKDINKTLKDSGFAPLTRNKK